MPLTSHARSLAATLVAALAVVWGAASITAPAQARTDRVLTSLATEISDVVVLTALATSSSADDDASELGTNIPAGVLGDSTHLPDPATIVSIDNGTFGEQKRRFVYGQRGPPEH